VARATLKNDYTTFIRREDDMPDLDGEQIQPGGSFETHIIIDPSDSENSESMCSSALVAVVKVEEIYKSPV